MRFLHELAFLNADSSSPPGSSFSSCPNAVCIWLAIVDRVDVTVVRAVTMLPPFVASFTGANLMRGTARASEELTEVFLDGGERVFSTDRGDGAVGVVVYPWEVSVARTHAPDADSALNVVRGRVGSLVEVANRVRVRVGPLTAEVTAASAARLELADGGLAYATFKATGTRLVPL